MEFSSQKKVAGIKRIWLHGALPQVPCVDYNFTNAPVCKYATLNAVLAASAHDDLHMMQFDVNQHFYMLKSRKKCT